MPRPRLRILLLSTTACLLAPVLAGAQTATAPTATQAKPAASASEGYTTLTNGTLMLPTLDVQGAPAATVGYQPVRTNLGAGVDTPILDIPQSIAVVPREVLRDQDARSLDDALANVSGITQANNLGGTQDAFTRRGFGDNRDGSIMIDGLRTIVPRSLNSTTDRVEVLKGPASALYGILDPGGMVNVITKQPELVQSGSMTLRGSSFGGGSSSMDLTGPLGGRFAYRIIGDYQNQEYWRNYGDLKRTLIAPSIAWYGDNTTIQANYWHEQYAVPFDRGTIFDTRTGKAVRVDSKTRFDEPYNISRGYTDYASLHLTHNFNADWTLTAGYAYSLNNYADQNARVVSYNPATNALVRRADATADSTMFSHAARADLAGKVDILGMQHDLLFGTSYDYSSTRRTELVRGTNNTAFNIFNPLYGRLAPPGYMGAKDDSDQTERLITESLYLQDAIHLSDRWILVGGIRYQHFDQIAGKGRPFNLNTDENMGRWVPRAGLVYKLAPDVSLFASYSQSFKPNSSIANVYGSPPPETGESWELGAKFDLAGGVTLTASAFNIIKENVLYRYDNAGASYTDTSGRVRSRGVELDAAGQITSRLSAIGSFAYIDAKVLEDRETTIVGKQLSQVAPVTASLFFNYDFGEILGDDRLHAGFGGRFMGARPGDRTNSFDIPSYEVFDAYVSYDTHIDKTPLRVALNVKNIFDKTYYTSTIGSNLGVAIGDPMQAILSATVRF